MELIQGTVDNSNLSTKDYDDDDIISDMPNPIITNILNRLPIQDAVRTSILARNWRLKWTLLTQLVFDKDFIRVLGKRQEKQNNVGDDHIFINCSCLHGGPYLPKYEELFLSIAYFEDGVEELVSGNLVCEAFSHVKSLTLTYVNFDLTDVSRFMYEIIWGLPNLQTLKIQGIEDCHSPLLKICTSMGQLQLLNVVFECFDGSKNQFLFVKKLLACSPLLRKITIRPDPYRYYFGHEKKIMFAKKLLMFERASPIAKVDLDMS